MYGPADACAGRLLATGVLEMRSSFKRRKRRHGLALAVAGALVNRGRRRCPTLSQTLYPYLQQVPGDFSPPAGAPDQALAIARAANSRTELWQVCVWGGGQEGGGCSSRQRAATAQTANAAPCGIDASHVVAIPRPEELLLA